MVGTTSALHSRWSVKQINADKWCWWCTAEKWPSDSNNSEDKMYCSSCLTLLVIWQRGQTHPQESKKPETKLSSSSTVEITELVHKWQICWMSQSQSQKPGYCYNYVQNNQNNQVSHIPCKHHIPNMIKTTYVWVFQVAKSGLAKLRWGLHKETHNWDTPKTWS